jgi:hypothetical protein
MHQRYIVRIFDLSSAIRPNLPNPVPILKRQRLLFPDLPHLFSREAKEQKSYAEVLGNQNVSIEDILEFRKFCNH